MASFQQDLVADIVGKFDDAETKRMEQEDVWSRALHNFRGKYYKDVHFTENEKSRAFVKVTKTKVLAAYGQIVDLTDNSGRLPITVSKTEVPESDITPPPMEAPGINPGMGMGSQSLPFDVGYAGDGKEIPPGSTFDTLSIPQEQPPMVEPQVQKPLPAPQEPDYVEAARKMEKLIHDQLDESDASAHIKDAEFECCLMGTGVIKGPFNRNKPINKWGEDGSFTQDFEKVPHIEFVSCWNVYPDPEAFSIDECDWVIQRHKMSQSQLLGLIEQPDFNEENIIKAVKGGANYKNRNFEMEVQAEEGDTGQSTNRWEVLEYWGVMDSDLVKDILQDEDISIKASININAWVCNDQVIRLVLNPFQPSRIPYLFFPYEKNPYSIWGVGVAENMDDAQSLMNGSVRMAIDNARLAGNVILDVDMDALAPGQDTTLYPGKVFLRQSGLPGQSIYSVKIQDTSQSNMMMFDRWRQIADESTGMPSYSHGNTGVTGMTRTAAGMSMLMGAANLNIKTVVKNLDTYLFGPLGKYYFYWNKQFYKGPLKDGIKGDLEVKAEGSKGLIQKEVKSQRLLTLLQLASNPAIAPMVNIQNLVWDIANTLDADAERYVNSPEQARAQAEIVGLQRQLEAQQQAAIAGGETGNGNATIGTGKVPQTGEPEFSGNGGTE